MNVNLPQRQTLDMKKPLEFRRMLIVGEFHRHDIGLWLSEREEDEGEVVLFDQRHPRGMFPKDEFVLLASSFGSFLERLAFCVERDLPLNPVEPSEEERNWLIENERAGVFPIAAPEAVSYSFRAPTPSRTIGA